MMPIGTPGDRSMLSDGSLLDIPIDRLSCWRCGSAILAPTCLLRLPRDRFGLAYSLNAGLPSRADIARNAGYAHRIAAIAGHAPKSVLDVGCGNGALLHAIGRIWPSARIQGVEPSPGAAAAARKSGLDVSPSMASDHRCELVICINVIEHIPDPVAFLRRLRRACMLDGRIILICPDGTTPWLELLMADHLRSLPPAALETIAIRAGLSAIDRHPAPKGDFQAIHFVPSPVRRHAVQFPDYRGMLASRRKYVADWRALDDYLLKHRDQGRRFVCFGCGETTRLLRAYAPRAWTTISAVTADDLAGAEGLGKPVIPIQEVAVNKDELLLAVRPQVQEALSTRLIASGYHVLRWDNLVPR